MVDARSTAGVRLLQGRCCCLKIPWSGADEGLGVWQERGEVRAVSFHELVCPCVTSWLNLLYIISLEDRADENARMGPSTAPEKRVRAGEVAAAHRGDSRGSSAHLTWSPNPTRQPRKAGIACRAGLAVTRLSAVGLEGAFWETPTRPAAALAALSPPSHCICPAPDPQGEMRRGSWAMATPRELKPPDSSRGSATR